ncbi:hypothetical protein A2Z33_05505 [Candidatus Gottesmanbacteria bacterium RBG_16_52_11]|uniref:Methyltransferase type 11 domain-containing protein n=1 Tax=Candidatus Gottesmanbacteria bacterium RBG_16_52_11 TaxID=1798374 RepID=A0A1F5YNA0_9BACT|nr:MAG: hypothetical protein A2Z33_05505 [Candidatus Gottesmanbacteria bacterium RBG_16_52_11]
MKKKVLNLGCGLVRIPGTIGVDRIMIEDFVDIVHDLNDIPYPFQKNSVDEIHMYHVLEHLINPVQVLEEIHRILKPGGLLHLRVPHFSSMGAFTDITHIRPYGFHSFDVFDRDIYHHFYTDAAFRIVKKEIKYFGLYPNDGLYEKYVHPNFCPLPLRPLVLLMNRLIRLSPDFFERLWCYWVGGATEIVLEMEKE